MWFQQKNSYAQLRDGQEANNTQKQLWHLKDVVRTAFRLFFCFTAGAVGFFAAQDLSQSSTSRSQLELETVTQTFYYNRSFSYPPSEHTKSAWNELFPPEGGFFTHPTIAPTRSALAVFHQLHCTNGIWLAYWANHDAAVHGQKLSDEDLPPHIQPSHVRHCIDLLRQTLMCHADTTIELVDKEIKGVRGFRTPHQCKNWEQLKQWTTEHASKKPTEVVD
ncbi:hypothetical protein BJ875DRAFT_399930 [Amylocarpus encephaloides]|uniref:Oxidase ustYa n=1 Tax=Amylocarpus encephaloides TaxID=45428 RepID=A0A9P7YJW2_9HELO|nr:hypothetical protein BJ875DRAFT_399930 [Amylocarpus encephaloides]